MSAAPSWNNEAEPIDDRSFLRAAPTTRVAREKAGACASSLSVEAVGLTHVGRRRQTNEDAFAVHPDLGLLMVADGLGGHAAGEIASKMTVDAIGDLLLDTWWPGAHYPPRAAGPALVAAIQHANEAVFAAGQRAPHLRGMGTTVVAAMTFHGCLAVAHVGDSRAYLLREKWLARLTEDHTVGAMLQHPGMELSAPLFTRYSHALTRTVGSATTVDVEMRYLAPRSGDVLLLCSDGLTNAIDDAEIAEILTAHRDLAAMAEHLVAQANENGGPDNVTVALQRWS